MADLRTGLYEHLITDRLSKDLATVPDLVQLGTLDPTDAHEALTRHIAELASRALRATGGSDAVAISRQVELANRIVAAIGDLAPEAATYADAVAEPARTLLAVAEPRSVPGPASFPERPATPLSTSALLVNGRGQPRIGYEVTRELASANDVDLLCAFIKWQGLRVLEKALARPARARRSGARHHDDVHGRHRPASSRPPRRVGRRRQDLLRDANDAAPRQGVAVSPGDRDVDGVRRLIEHVPDGADRRAGVERSPLERRAGAPPRDLLRDVRQLLG